MAGKRRVLVTGAAGYVASQMLDEFSERYDLVMADVTDLGRDGQKIDGLQTADFIDTDRSKYQHLFEGADAVIHLSYKRSSEGGVFGDAVPHIDRFAIESENVVMANNVYRAAYDAGVRRMVVASSNHAADWYEHALVHAQKKDVVQPWEYPVSDNFYGWAKAAYELLAWPYACGKFGRKMEFVQVRIGYPREVDAEMFMSQPAGAEPAGGPVANFKRHLGTHFSARDLRQLFGKAIETPDISDEHGVPYLIVYGISGNTRRFWSLESARNVLGYEPEDDSEVKYEAAIRRYLTGPDAKAGHSRVGG
ncbi:MAG: NAD(P)-dependent oxidoreductase [Chloroflexi bacterium]|nr:NAD(P)-dependent oxidoreductase [Chloroflexota bacterium]